MDFDFVLRILLLTLVDLAETLFDVIGLLVFDCIFFVVTREERTDDCTAFCALFFSVVETFLFAFFNGDTDDLHGGGVAVAWVTRRYGHEHVESFHDLSEDTVFVVQVRCWSMGNEEL